MQQDYVLILKGKNNMFNEKDKIISENDKCQFAVNSWTEGAESYATKTWGLNLRCLLAIQKACPTDRDYILVVDNEVVYSNKSYETIGAHIDMMALNEGKIKLNSW
jgi:hypothetical protein